MDMPKEMTVRSAVLAHDGKFPRQLACSGVMFWDGVEITLADFKAGCRKLGMRFSVSGRPG